MPILYESTDRPVKKYSPLKFSPGIRNLTGSFGAYPSDAPLPKFKITKVMGQPYTIADRVYVRVRFDCEIMNYQEVSMWFSARQLGDFRKVQFRFTMGYAIQIDFGQHVSDDICLFFGEAFGRWNSLAFGWSMGVDSSGFEDLSSNPSYTYNPSLCFCDVYIPFPSDLPSGVWTDLQFREAQGAPSLKLVAGVALGTFALVGIGYLYHKRKRK